QQIDELTFDAGRQCELSVAPHIAYGHLHLSAHERVAESRRYADGRLQPSRIEAREPGNVLPPLTRTVDRKVLARAEQLRVRTTRCERAHRRPQLDAAILIAFHQLCR